jgi:hypothetical protein
MGIALATSSGRRVRIRISRQLEFPSRKLALHFVGLVLLVERPHALAAGSPVVEPRPLGTPLCAFAKFTKSASAAAGEAVAREIVVSFMAIPFGSP